MDISPPPRDFTLTPNLDKNEGQISSMKPHMVAPAVFSSGATDICLMLNRVLNELKAMNAQMVHMNSKLDELTVEVEGE